MSLANISYNSKVNPLDGVRVIIHNQTLDSYSIKYETLNSFTKNPVINENMISFTVYYENLDYTVIDQVAQMKVFDLITNIGGNIGLFIGISFLSFAEFIELLVEIIYILFF